MCTNNSSPILSLLSRRRGNVNLVERKLQNEESQVVGFNSLLATAMKSKGTNKKKKGLVALALSSGCSRVAVLTRERN